MKLAHPYLKMTIEDKEAMVNVLVIENEEFFYETVRDIYNQINGLDGKYVLSKNDEPIQMSKNLELITQFVPFDINRKSLITKLYAKLKNESVNNYYVEMCELNGKLLEYLSMISSSINADIVFDSSIDISGVFKLANVKFEEAGDSIAEKMISYMMNVRELEGDKWFLTVGLKSYLNQESLKEMYRSLALNKFKLMLIESSDKEMIEGEKKYIIDKDMCEIY